MSSSSRRGKPVLPQGWVTRQSSSHPEMVYYFNIITGASTWEQPHLIAKADSTVQEESTTPQKEESHLQSAVRARFLAQQSPHTPDGSVTSSGECKKTDKKEIKKDIIKLEKQRRALIQKIFLHEPSKKSTTHKKPSSTPVQKKYLLKRKSVDVPIAHKKTCRKFKKNVEKAPVKEASMESNDVEMIDLSKEIAPLKNLKSPVRSSDKETKPYFIVVDTNILIHDLNFVDELKDKPLQGHGPPVIVVPWIVVQELDGLKCGGKGFPASAMAAERGKQAADAIRFLNTMLMAQHPRIRGQTYNMAMQEVSTLKPKCNDDKVLQCCLQLLEVSAIPRERVVLLTNDKNLCNKAIINEIKAHTTDSILNDFQVDFCPVKKPKPPVYSAFANFPIDVQIKMIAEVKAEVDTIVCCMKALLKESLSKILEKEMKNAYGDIWLKTIFLQPPWSLLDILECFKKHWFALFSSIFSRNMFSELEMLRSTLRETKGYIYDEHQAAKILSSAITLCVNVEKKYKDMSATIKELKNLQKQCENLCQKTEPEPEKEAVPPKPKDLLSAEERHKQILMVFQQTWSSLNNVCGTVSDSLGQKHTFKYEPPSKLPSKSETIEFLEKLYGPLKKLTQCMHNVLRSTCTKDENLNKATSALHECLTNFLPGLELPMPIPVEFSAKDMEEFCKNPSKKELLDNGNQQLLKFYGTIHHYLSFFSDDVS